MLTSNRIQELSNQNGVRKVAVENFLYSVGANPNKYCALLNLESDAISYSWNEETENAIRQGIDEYFEG